jgi:hypothetical protein
LQGRDVERNEAMRDTIELAREAGIDPTYTPGMIPMFKAFEALVRADERERICKAIKEEDDYCVTEGDYMLDSDDCIAVTKGVWVRPEFSLEPIRAKGEHMKTMKLESIGPGYGHAPKQKLSVRHVSLIDAGKTPPVQPAVPDAMTSADIQESIEYVAGWNDCRQAMLEMMK